MAKSEAPLTAHTVGLKIDFRSFAKEAAMFTHQTRPFWQQRRTPLKPVAIGLVLLVAGAAAVSGCRWAVEHLSCNDCNLMQLALALITYQQVHGQLPPAIVCDKDGKPLYSWRVLLLPFLEEEPLYNEFHLDEPWDSANNSRLLPRMPGVYSPPACTAREIPPYHTMNKVFYGEQCPFEGQEGLRIGEDFSDGFRTFLVVEAGEPVPWTMPADLDYSPNEPLPDLTGAIADGFRASMCNGSTRLIVEGTPESDIRAFIIRKGNKSLRGNR
jgi:hypothetical protein